MNIANERWVMWSVLRFFYMMAENQTAAESYSFPEYGKNG